MLSTFRYDLLKLSRYKFSVKYSLPGLMCLIAILIIGQLLTEMFTLGQLNKITGVVTGTTKIKEEEHDYSKETAGFSLNIVLDNSNSFVVENYDQARKLNEILTKGSVITIYYPTMLLKILSAGFTDQINQLEYGNNIFITFKSQKGDNRYFAGFLFIGLLFFYGFYRYLLTLPMYNPWL